MSIKENKQEPVLVEPEASHTIERGTHETRQAKPAVAALAFLAACTVCGVLASAGMAWLYDFVTGR